MQVVCDGLDLSEAVIKVSRAIAYKTTNPILEGIKIVADNDYVIVMYRKYYECTLWENNSSL